MTLIYVVDNYFILLFSLLIEKFVHGESPKDSKTR